ncbi:MAG: hypothetical protein QOE36_1431 [Gaiellaceae bacterium]|nr:hypothetical protein [Gaiellaceae bacterium]
MRGVVAGIAATLVLALPAAAQAVAFVPNDPLFPRQWYVGQVHAFDAWDAPPTTLAPVLVAVVDSGIDAGHPEFAGRIAAKATFVGGSAGTDEQGHGTFVAGEIAAATNNGVGIAGVALSAKLVVAKVVESDGTIFPQVEAKAIRWAVAQHARVINLSFGALRDPADPTRDEYSPVEAAAIRYAVSKGALVVAAVGNGDQAPTLPWAYASYPAALPHVLGVSALTRDGNVPGFSDRDTVYNDLSAPGADIFSTFPRNLTARSVGCVDQGYSDCADEDYKHAEGTSFAAPLVSAAAALMFASNPALTADQAAALLEHTVDDVAPISGCRRCPPLRDALSGWGRLNVAAALAAEFEGPWPARDRSEPNDDAGTLAPKVYAATGSIAATIDYWDDPTDVYRVYLRRGQRLTATVEGPTGVGTAVSLWKPSTRTVFGASAGRKFRVAQAVKRGTIARAVHQAKSAGWYYVQVSPTSRGYGAYTLRFTKS